MEPECKKRKGGVQQRIRRSKEEAAEATPSISSGLAAWLKEKWSWGTLSPQEVQHIAALAVSDMENCGLENPPSDLLALASLGSHGRHCNNVHRDLMLQVQHVSKLPAAEKVIMPMKVPGGSAEQTLVLPHLVFHSLYEHYQTYWGETFLPGGRKSLMAFWKNISTHPCMKDHCLWERVTRPCPMSLY